MLYKKSLLIVITTCCCQLVLTDPERNPKPSIGDDNIYVDSKVNSTNGTQDFIDDDLLVYNNEIENTSVIIEREVTQTTEETQFTSSSSTSTTSPTIMAEEVTNDTLSMMLTTIEPSVQPISRDNQKQSTSQSSTISTQTISNLTTQAPPIPIRITTELPALKSCYIVVKPTSTISVIISQNGFNVKSKSSEPIEVKPEATVEIACPQNHIVFYHKQAIDANKLTLTCLETGFPKTNKFNITTDSLHCVHSCKINSVIKLKKNEKTRLYLPTPMSAANTLSACVWNIHNLNKIIIKYNIKLNPVVINSSRPFLCVSNQVIRNRNSCFKNAKKTYMMEENNERKYPDGDIQHWTYHCRNYTCTIIFRKNSLIGKSLIHYNDLKIELYAANNSLKTKIRINTQTDAPKTYDPNSDLSEKELFIFEASSQIIIGIVVSVIIILLIVASLWAYRSWNFKQYSSPLRKLFRRTPLDYISNHLEDRRASSPHRIRLDVANSRTSSQRSISQRMTDFLGSRRSLSNLNRTQSGSHDLSTPTRRSSRDTNQDRRMSTNSEMQDTPMVFLQVPKLTYGKENQGFDVSEIE